MCSDETVIHLENVVAYDCHDETEAAIQESGVSTSLNLINIDSIRQAAASRGGALCLY